MESLGFQEFDRNVRTELLPGEAIRFGSGIKTLGSPDPGDGNLDLYLALRSPSTVHVSQ